jgi:hypothetical protein
LSKIPLKHNASVDNMQEAAPRKPSGSSYEGLYDLMVDRVVLLKLPEEGDTAIERFDPSGNELTRLHEIGR